MPNKQMDFSPPFPLPNGYVPFVFQKGWGPENHSFLESIPGKKTIRLQLFSHPKKSELLGWVYFGKHSEGPPKITHGGAVAYVFDEVMACLSWHQKKKVLAKQIEVQFLRPVPIQKWVQVRTRVIRTRFPNVYVRGEIFYSCGKILSQAKGIFHLLSKEQLERFQIPTKNPPIPKQRGY